MATAAAGITRTVRIVVDARPAREGGNVVKRTLQEVDDAAQKTEARVQQFGSALTALKGIMAGLGIGALLREFVQAGLAMNSIANTLKAVTDSAALAAVEMAFLRAEANRLGLDLKSSAEAYGGLAAAAKGTSLEGEQTRKIFVAVSEAMTALGRNSEQTQGALLAIQQMMSKGTVQAEELRGQLGERLPGAFQMAAKAMGVTTAELGKMLEGGKVISEDFLPKFAKALHDAWGQGALDAARGLQANLNRMQNAITEFGAAVLNSGFGDALNEAITKGLNAGNITAIAAALGNVLGEAVRGLTAAVEFLAANFDAVAAAAALFISAKTVSLIAAITTGLWGMVAAGIAFAATPFGAVVTAIAAITAALVYFRNEMVDVGDRSARVWDILIAGVEVARERISDGVNWIREKIDGLPTAVMGGIKMALNAVIAFGVSIVDVIGDSLSAFGTVVTNFFGELGTKLVSIMSAIPEAISLAVQGEFTAAGDAIGRAIGGGFQLGIDGVWAQTRQKIETNFSEDYVGALGGIVVDGLKVVIESGSGAVEGAVDEVMRRAQQRAIDRWAATFTLEADNLAEQAIPRATPRVSPIKAKEAGGKGIESYYQQQTAALTKQLETFLQLDDAAENYFEAVKRGGKGLTQSQAEQLAALQNTLNAFKALDKAGKGLQSAMDAIRKDPYSGATSALAKLIEAQRALPGAVSKARDELAKAKLGTDAYEKAQAKLNAEMDRFAASGESYKQGLEAVTAELGQGVAALRDSVSESQAKSKALDLEIDGSDEARKALQELTRQRALDVVQQEREKTLGPLRAQLRQAEADGYEDIAEALRGTIAEYENLYKAKAAADVEIVDKERLKADAEEAREAFQEPFREAARSIQSSLADTFANVFRGGIKSFKDLGKSILDIFITLAAQIAALLVFRPVVGGLLSAAGASDSFMRSLGIAPTSSAGGATSSAGGFDITSLFGGGNLMGGGNSPFASIMNTTLFGGSGGSVGAAGAFYGGEAVFGPGSSAAMGASGAAGAATGAGFTVGNAIPFVGAGLSIMNAAQNPNVFSIGSAAATTGGAIMSLIPSMAAFGPWGMAAGAVLAIMGSIFGSKKPSNKGAEYAFNLDDDFSTAYEGTKHADQMAFVRSFADPLQSIITSAENRFGIARREGAVIGANYGIKEGSSFYYQPSGGTMEDRQRFEFDPEDQASIKAASDSLMVAFLRDADWSGIGERMGAQAAADVATAVEASSATTLDDLLADIDFAAQFQSFVEIGQGTFDPIAASYRQAVQDGKAYAQGIIDQGRAFRQTAEDLGLGTEELEGGLTRADQATRGYILSLFENEQGMSAATFEIVKQKAAIAELETALLEFNVTAEEATTITDGLTQALKDGFINDLQAELNQLDGREYLNVFDSLIAKFGEQSDMAWQLSDTEAELAANMALVNDVSTKRIQAYVDEIVASENNIAKLAILRGHMVDVGWATDVVDNALLGLGVSLADVANGVVGVTGAMQSAVAGLMAAQQTTISLAQAQATLTGKQYVPGSATELVYGAIGGSNAGFNSLGQGLSPVFFQTIDSMLAQARAGTLTQSALDNFASTNLANQSSYQGRWGPGELNAIAQALRGAYDSQRTNYPDTTSSSGGGGGGGAANDNSQSNADRDLLATRRDEERSINDLIRAQEQLRDSFGNIADRLKQFRESLLVGALSPLTPQQQLAEARRQFEETLLKAQGGDEQAMQDLENVSSTFLDKSRQFWASSENYQDDFTRVQNALLGVENKARDLQAEAVAQLVTLNSSLLKVQEEIAKLEVKLNPTGGGSSGTPGTPSVPTNPTVPTTPTSPSYAFGYANLGRRTGESAQSFMQRMFPTAAATLMADGVITEQEGYNWSQATHPSGLGLTNAAYFAAARSGGFMGPFGSGSHTAWLNADASGALWRAFIDELRARSSVSVPGDGFFNSWGAPRDFGSERGYAAGGLVTGGIPGMDSVPAMLMPGERVFSVPHSRIIEGLAARGSNDNREMVQELRALRAEVRLVVGHQQAQIRQNEAAAKFVGGKVEQTTAEVKRAKPRQIDPGAGRRMSA